MEVYEALGNFTCCDYVRRNQSSVKFDAFALCEVLDPGENERGICIGVNP